MGVLWMKSSRGNIYRLRLIGPFRLSGPDGARIEVSSRKGRALIAMLAMAPDGERTRGWLQDRLWGSRPGTQAQASLRRELANLRLAVNGAAAAPLLNADYQRAWIDLAQLEVDALNGGGPGEFLEGIDLPGEDGFEDWLREMRQALDGGSRPQAASPMPSVAELLGGALPALPVQPSIAVLPFADLSPGRDLGFVADGVAEDVSGALARRSTLFVVAAGSTDGPPLAGSRLALSRQLGVRFLVEGSVRGDGERVRVSLRLIDGPGNRQVWAQRFEGPLTDLFALQDHIAATIAPLIDSQVETTERQRALSAPLETADSYQLFWRANALFRQWQRDGVLEAAELTAQLLALEPANAWAAALSAFCHAMIAASGWAEDPAPHRAKAQRHYDLALRHGGDDPFVLGYAAGVLLCLGGDMAAADRLIDRALELQPSSASTLFWGGWVDVANGKAARGLERFQWALRLSPRSAVRPYNYTGMALCLLGMGQTADALLLLNEAAQHIPTYPPTLAALCLAQALSGDGPAAATTAARLAELGGVERALAMIRDPRAHALIHGLLPNVA
jgi:TolB-like protein